MPSGRNLGTFQGLATISEVPIHQVILTICSWAQWTHKHVWSVFWVNLSKSWGKTVSQLSGECIGNRNWWIKVRLSETTVSPNFALYLYAKTLGIRPYALGLVTARFKLKLSWPWILTWHFSRQFKRKIERPHNFSLEFHLRKTKQHISHIELPPMSM